MSDEHRVLETGVTVSGQLDAAQLEALKDRGVALVINHRPDGEESAQPDSASLASAARALGLNYAHIPVRGLPDDEAVAATQSALAAADGPAHLFCRSGMRSTVAWALARRSEGADPETLREAAARAGYDLGRVEL